MSTAKVHVLIACGGTGSRAGGALPKQYQEVAGQCVLTHTLHAFAAVPAVDRIVCVIAPADTLFSSLVAPFCLDKRLTPVAIAGETRAQTVVNGLRHLIEQGAAADDWVLVHDAARCLVTPELIRRLIAQCQFDTVGGLLAIPLADTLKQAVDGKSAATCDRSDKWLAQTPQMFKLGALLSALSAASEAVTDEASAMEQAGHAPRLVLGSAQNFKITYPEDFALAELILSKRGTTL